MIRWSFVFLSLLASCIAQTASQAVPQEQLTVRVSYEDDRRASANLRVELLSTYGSSIETRVTDGFGSVIFSRLQPAKYRLKISGMDIVTTETNEIDLTQSGPNATEYVSVKKVKEPNPAGLTSTADLNVPPEAKKEFEKGASSMEKKNWAEAKDHFTRAISFYGKYASAYNGLAMSYLKLNQGPQAVEAFRSAMQLDENQLQANAYLGQFYYENKNYKQAEPCLLRAAAADPKNAQVLMALANTQLKNGEADQALASAQKVHSLADHQKYAIVHLIAAEALSGKGDNQKVADEYRLFLQEAPSSPMAGRVKDALATLTSAAAK
jgi:tetratricopeptide (TPR) repeat protein